MVKFDSKTHVLSLTKDVYLSDGAVLVEMTGQVNLSSLSEPERQRLIAVAKLVTDWCHGNDIKSRPVTKDKAGESVEHPSRLDKVAKLVEHKPEKVETPEKAPASEEAAPEKG